MAKYRIRVRRKRLFDITPPAFYRVRGYRVHTELANVYRVRQNVPPIRSEFVQRPGILVAPLVV
jgi:hypothetical protein